MRVSAITRVRSYTYHARDKKNAHTYTRAAFGKNISLLQNSLSCMSLWSFVLVRGVLGCVVGRIVPT